MKKEKIVISVLLFFFLQYLFYLFIHYIDTKNLTLNLDKNSWTWVVNNLNNNSNSGVITKTVKESYYEKVKRLKKENLEELNKNYTNFRYSSENNSKFFLNFICKNNNWLKKIFIDSYTKDKDINSFLSQTGCYNKMVTSMLDLSIINNNDTRNYFYNNCWINKSEIEGHWYFWGNLESSNLIMAWYYLWYINKEDTIINLNKLNLFLNKDNEKYFLDNEKEYSKLYYDILTWVKYTNEDCDKTYIVNYDK